MMRPDLDPRNTPVYAASSRRGKLGVTDCSMECRDTFARCQPPEVHHEELMRFSGVASSRWINGARRQRPCIHTTLEILRAETDPLRELPGACPPRCRRDLP